MLRGISRLSVILAVLWLSMPLRSATAQSPCPERGCRIFLPVMGTQEYMRVSGWTYRTLEVARFTCIGYLDITLDNVSATPVASTRLQVIATWNTPSMNEEPVQIFTGTLSLMTFPDEKSSPLQISIGGAPPPLCPPAPDDVQSSVVQTQLRPTARRVAMVSSVADEGSLQCTDRGEVTYVVANTVRNDTSAPLTDLHLLIWEQEYAIGSLAPLLPGATASAEVRAVAGYVGYRTSSECPARLRPLMVTGWGLAP